MRDGLLVEDGDGVEEDDAGADVNDTLGDPPGEGAAAGGNFGGGGGGSRLLGRGVFCMHCAVFV